MAVKRLLESSAWRVLFAGAGRADSLLHFSSYPAKVPTNPQRPPEAAGSTVPVDVAAVLGGEDGDYAGLVVDRVQHSVAAAASRPASGKLAPQGLSDSSGLV